MPITLSPATVTDEAITWVDPLGVAHLLMDRPNGYGCQRWTSGRFLAPGSIVEDALPFMAGARRRRMNREPRDHLLRIRVSGSTQLELRGRVRQLMAWLDTTEDTGLLRFTGPDGDTRELVASVTDVDDTESLSTSTNTNQIVAVTFHGSDPNWREISDTEVTYTVDVTLADWFPFTFPFYVSGPTVFARPTIDNTTTDGDTTDTYPVWTFVGPGVNPTVRNLTTGEITVIQTTLDAGDRVVIDTRPEFSTVTDGAGTNLLGLMTSQSSLWPFVRGVNTVQMEMASISDASSVTLQWRKRFLNA